MQPKLCICISRVYSVTPNNVEEGFNNCPTRCDLFSLLHFCMQLYMFWVSTPETCRAAYRNVINNKLHLVGQLLNSIHDEQTHTYTYIYIYIYKSRRGCCPNCDSCYIYGCEKV